MSVPVVLLAAALATTPVRTAVGFLPSLRSYDKYRVLASIRAQTVVVSGGADQWVRIWDVASGELLKSLENARKVKSIAWHPSKELVAAGANHLLLNPISRHAEQLEAVAELAGLE